MDGDPGQVVFTAEQVADWRRRVARRREELFQKSWKNRRPEVALRTREQEQSIQFMVEWAEEFDDVVGRVRDQARLDTLIGRTSGPEARAAGVPGA